MNKTFSLLLWKIIFIGKLEVQSYYYLRNSTWSFIIYFLYSKHFDFPKIKPKEFTDTHSPVFILHFSWLDSAEVSYTSSVPKQQNDLSNFKDLIQKILKFGYAIRIFDGTLSLQECFLRIIQNIFNPFICFFTYFRFLQNILFLILYF